MIRRELREAFPDVTLRTCKYLVYQAKQRIRERYNIDPAEYKGLQITFYEAILRNKAKTADKLKAAERLDKLFGLENIATVDPAALAEKILAFKKQALKTLKEEKSDARSEHEGDSETKDEQEASNDALSTPTKAETIDEDMANDAEALDNLKLSEED